MGAPRIIRPDREASELRHPARPIASAKWPSPIFTDLRRKRGSGGEKHAVPREVEAAAPEGLQLQFAQLSLYLSLPHEAVKRS